MYICNYSNCTGCMACLNTCSTGAISIKENIKYGFVPEIDRSKCVNCGKCKRICPVQNHVSLNKIKKVYAVWSNDISTLKTSSSGGAAYVLSKFILTVNGVVYGACFDDNFQVKHMRITELRYLKRLQGSKYVQSNISLIYNDIKQDIKNGKIVLFIGTGCQVAGVKTYLGEELSEKVIFVDLVCHGTPSAKCFRTYTGDIIKDSKISSITFRKDNQMRLCISSGNNEIYNMPFYNDAYYLAFELGVNLRESCYNCIYASTYRTGDITLGDFHQLNRTGSTFHTVEYGTSMVCINTQKGKRIFDSVKMSTYYETHSLNDAVKNNPQLTAPTIKHGFRSIFLKKCGGVPSLSLKVVMKPLLIKYTIKNKISQNRIIRYALTRIGR